MSEPDFPPPFARASGVPQARRGPAGATDLDGQRRGLEDERRARIDAERQLATRTEELAHANAEMRVLVADYERRLETRTNELGMARELANQAQRRTAEIATEFEQSGHAKNAFLARMAHEIRTPLSAMMGYATLIADSSATRAPNQTADWAHSLKRGAEYLQSLVADILDLSQIQGGEASLELAPTSIERVMTEVAGVIGQSATARALSFGLNFETAMPEVLTTDVVRLRQVLMHLGNNAVRFTPKGGVELRARLVSMSDASGRGTLELEVRDTGIGIAPDGVERIFEPFTQVHGNRETYGGAGLGLHITRRLVQWLGGSISVTSNLGMGSCFRVTLPVPQHEMVRQIDSRQSLRPTGVAAATPPAAKPAQPLAGTRILVVDDSQEICYVLRVILQRAGAEVECAFSGEAGLELLERASAPFDVALLDLQLPGISGIEAAIRMKQRGDAPRAIIALTANANPDAQRDALKAGCDEFLVKPVPAAHLQATIVTLLRRAGHATPPDPRGPAQRAPTTPPPGQRPTPAAGAQTAPPATDPTLEREDVDIPEELHRSYLGFLAQTRHDLAPHLAPGALEAGAELDPLRRLAHKLASSGGSFGYPAITHYARRVESLAQRDMADDLLVALQKLVTAIDTALTNAAPRGQRKP